MTDRIDTLDPLIVRVTLEEWLMLTAAYEKMGCTWEPVGDGIILVIAGAEGVIARYRTDRTS